MENSTARTESSVGEVPKKWNFPVVNSVLELVVVGGA